MTKEFSAGGIVFRKIRNSKSEIRKDNVLWLVCQHSQHKGWVFPKGLIGDHIENESVEATAIREVEEETGVKGEIIKKLTKPATYFYMWQGDKRFKTVYYFLMKYLSGDINKHDFEMSQVEWLPTEKVLDKLTYKSDKTAFQETLSLIDNLLL